MAKAFLIYRQYEDVGEVIVADSLMQVVSFLGGIVRDYRPQFPDSYFIHVPFSEEEKEKFIAEGRDFTSCLFEEKEHQLSWCITINEVPLRTLVLVGSSADGVG